LRNVIERVVVLARGRMIGSEELDFLKARSADCLMTQWTLKEAEQNHIQAVLAACDGNISQAAKRLGIDRVTLSRKIKRHQSGHAG
jgi:transcriptional regulator of acetoin/glycerol metabolism